jgi:hypothetical protein
MTDQKQGLTPEQERLLDEAIDYARNGLSQLETIRSGGKEVYAAARLLSVEHGFAEACRLVGCLADSQAWIETEENVTASNPARMVLREAHEHAKTAAGIIHEHLCGSNQGDHVRLEAAASLLRKALVYIDPPKL